jgi:thiamine pyrophosphokinase
VRYPSEKYATDLELAIDCARHEAARQGKGLALTVTCASGGRPDHALAVMGRLARAADASPRLVEDGFECRVLAPQGTSSWAVGAGEGSLGATFSAIPLAEGTVVSEAGMRWELDRRALPLLSDEGVSNVVECEDARVTCHEGVLAAFVLARHDA